MSQSSSSDEKELQKIEESARAPNTRKSTVYGVKKFSEWLEKRNKTCDFFTVSPEELNELL